MGKHPLVDAVNPQEPADFYRATGEIDPREAELKRRAEEAAAPYIDAAIAAKLAEMGGA